MKLRFPQAPLALAISLLLGACGGGSSGDDKSTQSERDDDRKPPKERDDDRGEVVLVGFVKVIDGYLVGAEVYADTNGNGTVDSGEPLIGETDTRGMLGIPESFEGAPLVAKAIANKTIDLDSGLLTTSFELSATGGSEVVTPFTHLANLTNSTLEQIATTLGVNVSLITGDYIAAKASNEAEAKKAHAAARYIVNELKEATPLVTIKESLPAVSDFIDDQVSEGKDADDLQLDYQDDGSISNEGTAGLRLSREYLTSVPTWSYFRIENSGIQTQGHLQYTLDNRVCVKGQAVTVNIPSTDLPVEFDCVLGYEINDKGQVRSELMKLDGAYTMVYQDESDIGGELVQTALVISESGALVWLDSRSNLDYLEDFVITQHMDTYFAIKDDSRIPDNITPGFSTERYSATATVDGHDLSHGIMLNKHGNSQAAWDILPLSEHEKYSASGIHANATRLTGFVVPDEQYYLTFRSAGDLMLRYEGFLAQGADIVSDSLHLASTNEALLSSIYNQWTSSLTQAFVIGRTFDVTTADSDTERLTFNADGSGSIKFAPNPDNDFDSNDINDIEWRVAADGILVFTEMGSEGNRYNWTLNLSEISIPSANFRFTVSGTEDGAPVGASGVGSMTAR